MRPHDKNTRPAARYVRSKDIFLQEREEAFDIDVWDGKGEREKQRNAPCLPMKWHSNKWVDGIFSERFRSW